VQGQPDLDPGKVVSDRDAAGLHFTAQPGRN
jgi:hypothetical protein